MNLGTKIANIRKSLRLDHGDIADYLGVDTDTVAKLENNELTPTVSQLEKIELLETMFRDYLGRNSDGDATPMLQDSTKLTARELINLADIFRIAVNLMEMDRLLRTENTTQIYRSTSGTAHASI